MTCQPTPDPVMNPVMALVTFDVGGILADNVGIMATFVDMLPKFPTKSNNQLF